MMVTETLDASTQAFLEFLTRQLTEHSQRIEPLDAAFGLYQQRRTLPA